jgi:hypothetical protein
VSIDCGHLFFDVFSAAKDSFVGAAQQDLFFRLCRRCHYANNETSARCGGFVAVFRYDSFSQSGKIQHHTSQIVVQSIGETTDSHSVGRAAQYRHYQQSARNSGTHSPPFFGGDFQ